MPHEMANWVPPREHDPARIYGTYVKTQEDEDGWDEAVIKFTGIQRWYHDGGFYCDHVNGGPDFAKRIIGIVERHQDEILRHCGFKF